MQILYVDDALIVVNKPAGLSTAPGGWNQNDSAPGDVLSRLQKDFGRVWIVHRLDRGTSGVTLFARRAEAHRHLSLLFETHQVEKVYHAISSGVPSWQERACRVPLRINVGHHHRTVMDPGGGKPAITHFRVLERFSTCACLEARPQTGRTHQIRAHLAGLGLPLLGDSLYGSPSTDLIARPALHAFSIDFEMEEHSFHFTAPHPDDFQTALTRLQEAL